MGRKSRWLLGHQQRPDLGGRGAFVPPGGRAPSDATVMREPDTFPLPALAGRKCASTTTVVRFSQRHTPLYRPIRAAGATARGTEVGDTEMQDPRA